MPKRVTEKRLPQIGRGKIEKKICPQCNKCYMIFLYKHSKGKIEKKAYFCECCDYIELIK
ncbi:hypothetical protein PSF70_17150 [Methanosarcina mazei]|nr:hypothetical protein PSF70_17105 [Methanosarcina mazei]WIM43161.1 hypothetical protein PSF70_17150 [Methanosarcina mazei]